MPEPMSEVCEENWIVFLNRFDAEIYPTLFAPRGYTKAEALIAWSLSRMEESIEDLKQAIEEERQ